VPPRTLSLATLHHKTTAELLRAWTKVVGQAPRCPGSREFLLLGLAWYLQAQQESGLTSSLTRQLKRLSKASRPKGQGKPLTPLARFQVGTVITKDWQGRVYTVMVQTDGFAFEGRTYQSLSEIARCITGTRWNGPAFFGLRPEPKRKKNREHQP
jgi:hypothetical protein